MSERKLTMILSIKLTEEERALAESYAKLHSISVSEAFKRALFDKIEDEYDLNAFAEYESEKQSGTLKTRPVSELWKELDL